VPQGDQAPTEADVQAALTRFASANARAIHRAQVALAELVTDLGPPGSVQHLELASRFVNGESVQGDLAEAKQECWVYVGSLACGCSVTDSLSAHVMLTCLEAAPESHAASALGEHVERVLRCGVSVERVLDVLKRLAVLAAGLLAWAWALPVAQAAPQRDPPLLFGGPVIRVKEAPLLDPRLPTGSLVPGRAGRPPSDAGLCSFTRPVCVHAPKSAAPDLPGLERALAALENAYERVVLGLRLPAPLADGGVGGSDALDWYLEPVGSDLLAEQEPLAVARFDSAAVFCRGGAAAGSLLDRAATLCVGEALASRFDAGERAEARRALALELWWIVGTKTALDVQIVDDAQGAPERALAADDGRGNAAGGFALLLEMLETTRSAAAPGILTASLFSAAASRTPPGAGSFDNEPDVFDVLRHSLEEDTTRYADLMIDFTLRRALSGDRDDGSRLPSLAFAGSFARPRFDWVIPFSSLPRRVLSGRPIAQTGAQLIWVELDDAPIGAAVGFRAEWEAPVAFQWRILLIDAQGREQRRVNVTFQDHATSADARVLRIDGAKAIIIAGFNVGGVDLAHPFDPDVAPFEPSACTVYLASM
jgi:hypothetical protein